MTEQAPYIIALQDKYLRFWQLDSAGNVTISAQPYFLNFSPNGWQDISVQNIKNKRYWGLDRTVSIPLDYVGDGAAILKHIFYTQGDDAEVYLSIGAQQLDITQGVNYGFWYSRQYRGQVDLSAFIHDGAKVTCSTLEDGLPKYLKANENTTFELSMNVPEAIFVKYDGIKLHNKANYSLINISDNGAGAFAGGKELATFPFLLLGQEGNGFGLTYLTTNSELINNSGDAAPYITSSANWFVKNDDTKDITFPFEGVLNFHCSHVNVGVGGSSVAEFYFETSLGIVFSIVAGLVLTAGQDYSYPYTFNVTLRPGESMFPLRWFHNDFQSDVVIEYKETSIADIQAITRRDATYVRCLRGQYIFEQLINKISEGNLTAAISKFFTDYKEKVFTCGNAIRGFDDAVMKINISDFFQDADSFAAVALIPIGDTVDLKEKHDTLDLTNIIDLGTPEKDTFRVSIAKEYKFNELEIGYPEVKNDIGVLNGNQVFCDKMLFSTGVSNSPAKLSKVTTIKADCYEQEYIRVTTVAKDTTDTKNDNDLYSVYIGDYTEPATATTPEAYPLNRRINPFLSGLIEPLTIFNAFLSPGQNKLRNERFLHSCFFMSDTKVLGFRTADKNADMVLDIPALNIYLAEKADKTVGNMLPQIFIPIYFDFSVSPQFNLLDLLAINPLQVFRITVDNVAYLGILNKGALAPATRKSQAFQLLSLPQDLTALKNYYG